MFSTAAFAQEVGGQVAAQASFMDSLIPLLLIFVVFWFLIIRPQSKKIKQHREMVSAVKRGDTVVTAGGLVGKVTKVREDDAEIDVEIAEGVKVKVVKGTLSDVRAKGEPQTSSADSE